WLCFPRFDSGACFAALLGTPEHGRWLLAPAGEIRRTTRRYRDGTLVLETDFETDDGAVTVVDAMPPRTEEPDLVRLVIGRRGRLPRRIASSFRFAYASSAPWVRRTKRGTRAVAGPDALLLNTPVDLHGRDLKTVSEFTVAEGEQVPFTLMWYPSHEEEPAPI